MGEGGIETCLQASVSLIFISCTVYKNNNDTTLDICLYESRTFTRVLQSASHMYMSRCMTYRLSVTYPSSVLSTTHNIVEVYEEESLPDIDESSVINGLDQQGTATDFSDERHRYLSNLFLDFNIYLRIY